MNGIKYCPFCGSNELKFVQRVPRCMTCRTVFLVTYSRKLRNAAKPK